MSKFCTGCGYPLEPGKRYCSVCGKQVEQPDLPDQQGYPSQQTYGAPVPPQGYHQPADDFKTVQVTQANYQDQPYQYPQYGNIPLAATPYTPPQPAPPKKSKKGLIIGLSITLAVVIIGLIAILILTGKNRDDNGKDNSASSSSSSHAAGIGDEKENETESAMNGGDSDKSKSDPFDGEDNIELTVWASDSAAEITKDLCREFTEQYPDKTITINIEKTGEVDAAAMVLNDADSAVDVFSFPSDQLKQLIEANVLAPVEAPEGVVSRNSDASVEIATVDGTLYAFPETADNGYCLVYDKSVVTDSDAKTLEGVLAACRKAKKKFVIDSSNGYYGSMFMFTGGLSLEGTDDGVQQFNAYDEENVVETLCAFAKIFSEYSDVILPKEVSNIASGFSDGTVAAGIDGNWDFAVDTDALGENFGAAKLPTVNVNGTAEQIISMHGYKMIGVNSLSAYPKAAQLLADYLTDEHAQTVRAEKLGWGPSNINAAADTAVTGNVGLAAILEQSKYSVPMRDIAYTFWTPTGLLGSYVSKGDSDPTRMKKEFEKAIENIMDY